MLFRSVIMEKEDIRETFAMCAENQKSIADKRNIAIVYDFPEMPVLLSYNEKHIYRALYNLIANALQYAKTKIILSCENKENMTVITVSDDGAGIAENDMPYIFDRFYKGENGKHGIGLSIAKSAIELHSGEIYAECSDMTHFTIKIPS